MSLGRGHLPYRGEPQPKFPKRRKQVRNLLKEKLRDKITIGYFLFLSIAALFIGMLSFRKTGETEFLAGFFLVFLFGLVLTYAISDGTKKINKFRKGYDIDESFSDQQEQDKRDDPES